MISEGHFNLTMSSFHSRTGSLVTLSNNNKTAQRNEPAQEFNNGVVVTEIPLVDNQLFEVRIDRKVNSWSGSIEIGVTRCDPNNLAFPASATGFREGTWIMSGSALLKDGHTIREEYGQDLDGLAEGDKVGVMRKSAGDLHFFVNGVDQGLAASNIPASVYGVVDMYGKCAQVTLCADGCREEVIANEITNEAIAEATFTHSNERLTFHEKCGSLVKLSNNRRTAERRRPMDEFNNGVVMTNRPVKDDELFEIRIDRMVDKWSGSIEVGITTHNPNTLEFPATMTNMRSGTGTIMMSGCGILTNGKGTRREYGEFNLDELREGDRIGLIRKSNGNLHYYINGIDQGIAATRTPTLVWGVVDLYGMAVKVTIVDGGDYPERGRLESQANSLFRQFRSLLDNQNNEEVEECEPLLFHSRCGSQCAIIDGGKTAHRPNAMEYFNHAVAFTNRMLKPGEGFEVRVDKMVDKWAGSLEIGVTTHSAEDLDNPSTMTNVRSGTWMMTGSGIMHNGTTTVDEYGYNLDRLNTGDRISVKRLDDGILHFYVNGVDQGVAASNVPSQVYGVVDLYGQAAQVSIIDNTEQRSIVATPTALNPVGSDHTELRFHQLHGRNAAVLNNGRSSQRPNARGEFNDAIVISNRPLRDNEMFEIVIEKMVDRWSGSIEAGVTLIKPEAIDFPNTMTDIDYDTWMLSGSAIMQDGSTIRNGYGCDLDILTVGSRIGMMRTSEGCLHFFVDGQDLGVACSDIPPGVYAVIDLYGQCAQVSITSGSGVTHGENQVIGEDIEDLSLLKGFGSEVSHRFSQCCGKNMSLRNNGGTACRSRSFDNGVVFSADPLKTNEIFEVKIDQLAKQWSGSFIIGLTTMAVSDNTSISSIPTTARDLGSKSKVTWIVSGSEVKKNGVTIKENYVASLDRLQVGNRVGVKRCSDASMHIYVNGDDMGVAATNIPRNVFVVMDLYGVVECVTIVSSRVREVSNMSHPPSISSDSTDSLEEHDQDTAESSNVEFNKNRGKNILLTNNDLTATRSSSYNQAIVVSHKPLQRQKLFQVKIDRLDPRWTSSLMIGVMGVSPDKYSFPVSATSIKKACWVVKSDSVFQSSIKVKQGYGPNLDSLQVGHHVGILIDGDNSLHLYVNGIDQGVAAKDLPVTCYALADLYGQCEQVTIVTENVGSLERPPADTTEKATMEDGIKEMKMTSSNHPQVELPLVKNCEYMNMCSRFKSLVGLPDAYFLEDQIRCYCDTCHKVRSDEPYSRRGSPPKDFALPFGWCKFPLKTHVRSNAHHVEENWHQAFHGTRVEVLRRILDTGDLQIPSDMCTYMLSPRPGHDKPADGSDSSQVFFSPTIKYVGLAYCPRYEYKDPKSKKTQFARVAFHVCVKPSSYKVGPQTVGAREPIDVRFNNQELEWSTKEKGATVLVGLLVKIEQ